MLMGPQSSWRSGRPGDLKFGLGLGLAGFWGFWVLGVLGGLGFRSLGFRVLGVLGGLGFLGLGVLGFRV